jgi:hypothetical protein
VCVCVRVCVCVCGLLFPSPPWGEGLGVRGGESGAFGNKLPRTTFSPNANGVGADAGEPFIASTPLALRLNVSHQAAGSIKSGGLANCLRDAAELRSTTNFP